MSEDTLPSIDGGRIEARMAPESLLALTLALNSSSLSASSASTDGVPEDALQQHGTRLSDVDLASRRAEEAAARRYEAAGWLRRMVGVVGSKDLPNEPSEEEFRLGLRNGIILCNVINKVLPGSVPKVVENPAPSVPPPDGAALSAYQYFENVRNFLVAVQEMRLPTFEASDLEKGGSPTKVVDCILALKSYSDWKETGGHGFWKYGGNLKAPSIGKPVIKSGKLFEPFMNSVSKNSQPPADSNALLHHLGVQFSDAFLAKENMNRDLLLNADGVNPLVQSLSSIFHANMSDKKPEDVLGLVESMLAKVMEEFERRQGEQLTMILRDLVGCEDNKSLPRSKVLSALAAASGEHKVEASEGDQGKQGNYGVPKGQSEKYFSDSSNEADEYGSLVPKLQMSFNLQRREIEELKYTLHTTREGVRMMQMEWSEELYNLEKHLHGLAQAAAGYHKVLEENRQLYNQVQDLKGSIRVYCRVRPFLPGQADIQSTVDFIGENGNLMILNPAKQGKDARKTFVFNKVFGSSASQEEVFLDTRPLIRSVLDGYNVCIFAYGQTGSGKTYTMTGPRVITEENWGVNYRALNDLFQISNQRKDMFAYEVAVQMIEIYNEQVRDLLASDGSNKRLEIRNNSQQNGLNVPDASLIPVASTSAVIDLMNLGHKNRAVGATALNDRSSRSHSVLTVHVQGKDFTSGSILRGCLHLVDLAGSERVDKSEATGERLKEAQHINKSLSALGDVIAALAQKNSHVPYRNSKLTQLLQDSLGGQAKTLMFVHISPEADAYGETISTLKFAERVATVELGAARSNKESGEIRELKEQIASLKNALSKKEAEAEQLQNIWDLRSSTERQRIKSGDSPLHLHRQGVGDVQTNAIHRQPMEDVGNIEVQNGSTGRQKKPIYGQEFSPDEIMDTSSVPVCDEDLGKLRKVAHRRFPDGRLMTLDRVNHTKSKIKHDVLEVQELRNWQDKVIVSKHLPTQSPASQDEDLKTCEAREQIKQGRHSDMYYQRYHAHPRKVYPDHDEEQVSLQQYKDEMHGRNEIRKSDIKGKHEYEGRLTTRYEVATTDESEIDIDTFKDDYLTSDSSEADILWQVKVPNVTAVTPTECISRVKKPQQRPAKTPERRSSSQAQCPSSALSQEHRLSNGNTQPQGRAGRQFPSGGMEGKRSLTGGGKSALEARVVATSPEGSSVKCYAKTTLPKHAIIAQIGVSSKPSKRWQ